MKKIILALATLAMGSSVYAACPNLAGEYTCSALQDQYDSLVEQSKINGVDVYTVTAEGISKTIFTDGKLRSLPDDEQVVNQKYTASCKGSSIIANVSADILGPQKSKVGNIKIQVNLKKTAQSGFEIKTNGHAVLDGQKQSINEVVTCLKK